MIFNIQRFSTHDGQGIRTIIFYKGCPLTCRWCCNPESQSFGQSLMYNTKLCKNFRDCLKTGTDAITPGIDSINIDRSLVQNPEAFTDICISKALTVSGEEKSVNRILAEIEKDILFYTHSGGGVTLSGGEPLAQGQEVELLLEELAKRNIDVAIETSLHVPWENAEKFILHTNTFLVDLKHTDKEKFNQFTGGDADQVLSNLVKLVSRHNNVILRVPVIPGFNHTEEEMKKIIDFAVYLEKVSEIHFLPFHNLGAGKYNMLGMDYLYKDCPSVEADELNRYKEYAESFGLTVKTGG